MKRSFALILFLYVFKSNAQDFVLTIRTTDKKEAAVPFIKKNLKFNSRSEVDSALSLTLKRLVQLSFIETSLDSVIQHKDSIIAFIHTGNPYQIKVLNIYDENINDKPEVIAFNRSLLYQNLEKLLQDILQKSLNNGYPFTAVYLDSIAAVKNLISANIIINKGQLFLFDTINYIGSEKINKRFMQNYLKMKPGYPYSEDAFKKSFDKIKTLGIVMPLDEVEPLFAGNKCIPVANLKYLARDEARALVGLNQDELTGKARLSGEAYLHLHNLFYSAREFELTWQSWKPGSQLFKVNAVWPFPLNIPLVIKAGGGLIKFDTLFTKLHSTFGFAYPVSSKLVAGFGIKSENTILTYADTTFVRNTKSLPGNVGLKQRAYFFEFIYKSVDFEPNPMSGILTKIIFSASDRAIKKDLRISQVMFSENGKTPYNIYDSLERSGLLRNYGFELDYTLSKFSKLAKKSTFVFSIEGKLNQLSRYYLSDLYRIGGNISLRGFNEQSIFATSYHFMNLEWRYLFGERSYVSLFYNIAAVENNSGYGKKGYSNPSGFGSSAKFTTNSSTFTIAYALGKESGGQFQFRNAKIHIGIINNF